MKKRATLEERIDRVVAKASSAGMLVACGDHYHFGDTMMETFDVETVVEGKAPVWLPDGNGMTDRLTLEDVRRLIQITLEEKDAERG